MSVITIFGYTFDPVLVRAEHARMTRSLRAEMRGQVRLVSLPDGVTRGGSVIWVGGEQRGGAPSFQFDDGRLRPAVAEVNRLLGGHSPSWGVLGWWLGLEVGQDGSARPIDLIGTPGEPLVVEMANHSAMSISSD